MGNESLKNLIVCVQKNFFNMLDLWTTLKLSLGEAKSNFFVKKFQTKLFSGKKKLYDEVLIYSSPKLQIDPVLLAQPSLKRPTSYRFHFFLLKNYVCFLFESATIGTSKENGWKLNEAKRGAVSRSSFISCGFAYLC